jgi:hypothetical protein
MFDVISGSPSEITTLAIQLAIHEIIHIGVGLVPPYSPIRVMENHGNWNPPLNRHRYSAKITHFNQVAPPYVTNTSKGRFVWNCNILPYGIVEH